MRNVRWAAQNQQVTVRELKQRQRRRQQERQKKKKKDVYVYVPLYFLYKILKSDWL